MKLPFTFFCRSRKSLRFTAQLIQLLMRHKVNRKRSVIYEIVNILERSISEVLRLVSFLGMLYQVVCLCLFAYANWNVLIFTITIVYILYLIYVQARSWRLYTEHILKKEKKRNLPSGNATSVTHLPIWSHALQPWGQDAGKYQDKETRKFWRKSIKSGGLCVGLDPTAELD